MFVTNTAVLVVTHLFHLTETSTWNKDNNSSFWYAAARHSLKDTYTLYINPFTRTLTATISLNKKRNSISRVPVRMELCSQRWQICFRFVRLWWHYVIVVVATNHYFLFYFSKTRYHKGPPKWVQVPKGQLGTQFKI